MKMDSVIVTVEYAIDGKQCVDCAWWSRFCRCHDVNGGEKMTPLDTACPCFVGVCGDDEEEA